jgi:hypothetical protein
MDKQQQSIFDIIKNQEDRKKEFIVKNEEDWKQEWQNMPEFVQSKTDKPFAQIIFRFANEQDLKDFSKLIGQKLTNKTKSAWYPQIERGVNANKIYVYEP